MKAIVTELTMLGVRTSYLHAVVSIAYDLILDVLNMYSFRFMLFAVFI